MSSDMSNSTSALEAGFGFFTFLASGRTASTRSSIVGFFIAVPTSSTRTEIPKCSPGDVVTVLNGIILPEVVLNPPTFVLKFCNTNAW